MITPFVRKLRRGAHLSDQDERLLADLCRATQQIGQHQDIFEEGDSPRSLTIVLSGWACCYKVLANGRRQIIAFFLPGDLCEPFGILPRFMDHAVGALTPLTYARVRPEQVKATAQSSPALDEAFWWDALVAMAMQNERVVSIGRRQAVERVGHLFCELQARLAMIGMGNRSGFELPLTQTDLADALGLSSVHINRSLQDLRGSGLIRLKGRYLDIPDLKSLQDASLFDPSFLHLEDKDAG